MPPKGTAANRPPERLTHTVPAWIPRAARPARSTLCVQTLAASPKSETFRQRDGRGVALEGLDGDHGPEDLLLQGYSQDKAERCNRAGVYREFVRETGLSREGARRVELAVGAVVA